MASSYCGCHYISYTASTPPSHLPLHNLPQTSQHSSPLKIVDGVLIS
ncbi:hypothetical protein PITC_077040 [Penicillium italicum]|uniref:Uncharacterized protein n=1 Tax=Penicillium italicum TaxID=40296 RepID=A0A0A2KLW8_PENIT|nr:hypothetical protein PITC_077040 [Penicillium italicum]